MSYSDMDAKDVELARKDAEIAELRAALERIAKSSRFHFPSDPNGLHLAMLAEEALKNGNAG